MSQHLPAPAPQVTQHDAAFWAATSEGRLLVGHCRACDQWSWPPTRSFCPQCGSDIENLEASGHGTLYSWTVIARGFGPYKDAGPYVLAYVALDEGPTVLTNVVNVAADRIAIYMPVSLVFARTGDTSGSALPRFQPADPDQRLVAGDSGSPT